MKWFWNRFGGWIIVTSFTFLGIFAVQIFRELEMDFLRIFVSTFIFGLGCLLYQVWFDHIKSEVESEED